MEYNRVFNLQKSPESKTDWHFNTIMRVVKTPSSFSLEQYCGKVKDQKGTGFCHSFSASAIKEIQENIETERILEMSPLYIAREVKKIDGLPNEEGTNLINICKTLANHGSIFERYYPFEKYKEGSLVFPELKNEDNLNYFKIKNYARTNTIEEMKQALLLKKPVLLGIMCVDTIRTLNNNKGKFVPYPLGGSFLGGHAVVIVGYDDTLEHDGHKGHFRIMNSWGETWGDKGFAWLPYDYITFKSKDIGFSYFIDAFTMVDLENDPIDETVIKMKIGDNKLYVNGKEFTIDQAPVIDKTSNRTLIPIRWVEHLGFNVIWNDKTKEITLVKEGE